MSVLVNKRDHRSTLRLDVKVTAWLREQGSSFKFDVDVIDLSMTGFRISTSAKLVVGQHVFITIPGIATLDAKIAWTQRLVHGASFTRPLHVAVFDHIAEKYRPDDVPTRQRRQG